MQFNFIAKYYRFISQAIFGNQLEEAKVSLFNKISEKATILIIGGGTGLSLEALIKYNLNNTIDFVEHSSEMIKRAKLRIGVENVNFYCCSIEEFKGLEYDVIITEFLLDLFSEQEIESHINLIKNKLSKKGIWIDTDFRNVESAYAKVMVKIMYLFFRIFSNVTANQLIETKEIAYSKGLVIRKEINFKSGFLTSRLICEQ